MLPLVLEALFRNVEIPEDNTSSQAKDDSSSYQNQSITSKSPEQPRFTSESMFSVDLHLTNIGSILLVLLPLLCCDGFD